MDTKELIIKFIKNKKNVRSKDLTSQFNITRQALNRHIKELIKQGLVIKSGNTKNSIYSYNNKKILIPKINYNKSFLIAGLEEDRVYEKVEFFMHLKKYLNINAINILKYSFTEILNNSIEHSMAKNVSVKIKIESNQISFIIKDSGIGIFHSLMSKYKLNDESEAVLELIKGKRTTMPEKHSGEGIFFTSKISDKMIIRSHKLKLIIDNLADDVFLEDMRIIKGTEVFFTLNIKTKKQLNKVFNQYAPVKYDYSFQKTRVYIKLFNKDYISRSEAKRLLFGLENFKEIALDFKGVNIIGQAFTDEIFRVYKNEHPDIIITTENINPSLQVMIDHVIKKITI